MDIHPLRAACEVWCLTLLALDSNVYFNHKMDVPQSDVDVKCRHISLSLSLSLVLLISPQDSPLQF